MKKFYLSIISCLLILTGCKYDDTDLWNAVDDITDRVDLLEQKSAQLNGDIAALRSIVDALQNNLTVTAVNSTETGYEIKFSDGTTATISHGRDGAQGEKGEAGVSAAAISVKLDSDGNYYWTLDGEWLIVEGNKVRANGIDGADGAQGIPGSSAGAAPKVRVNPDTKEWEISVDGGTSWTGTGVKAEGKDGDSMFASVDTTDPSFVKFVMADGSEFKIARFDETAPAFVIEGIDGMVGIPYGESTAFNVTATNIANYSIQKPDGWKVSYNEGKLTVTAPIKENTYAEKTGAVSIVVISGNNKSMIVKFNVETYELKLLTFEDSDAKFSAYTLGYCSKNITKWSDLIAGKQYGDPMLYGTGMGMDEPYWWYDENNTFIKHVMNGSEDAGYCFWYGGHVLSNYYDANFSGKSFNQQLEIAVTGASAGHAGHNGSANFCIQNGYADNYNTSIGMGKLTGFSFGDDVERVIDHLYVTNTSYGLNSLANGDGFNSAAKPTTWVKIVAYGWDKSGQSTGTAEVYLCKDGKFINEWTKFDLSPLGKVAKVEFNFAASDDQKGSYGLNFPAYFAYDDVAVRF